MRVPEMQQGMNACLFLVKKSMQEIGPSPMAEQSSPAEERSEYILPRPSARPLRFPTTTRGKGA